MICYNCEKRYLGCHSTCPEYLEYKNERQQYNDNKLKTFPINDYTYDEHKKACKNYRRKFKK